MNICQYCNKEFRRNSNSQRYCSEICQRNNRKNNQTLRCSNCGRDYQTTTSRKIYCSDGCRIKAKATRIAKPKINKNCRTCGKEFEVTGKSRQAVYCSELCRKQRYKERLIEKKCPQCFNSFKADKRTICCSNECKKKYMDTKIELNCIVCGKSFKAMPSRLKRKASQKCCSNECYRASRRTGKSVNCNCNHCGKGFYKAPSLQKKHDNNFCSVECMGSFYSETGMFSGENSATYIGSFDRHKKYYGPDWHPQRRAARKRDKYICQRCGVSELKYGQELSVHHLIPFIKFDDYLEANELSNLISLCEPCHRKEHSGDNHPTKYL